MLKIIQSNQVEQLFTHLIKAYTHPTQRQSVFEPFQVIVPSKVMGEWLKKQVADQAGISTLVTTEFWGRYFLGLMQRVLRTYGRYHKNVLEVPEVAMLSKSVMQWQIFGFLLNNQTLISQNQHHPFYPFLAPLLETQSQINTPLNTGMGADGDSGWANQQTWLSSDDINQDALLQTFEQRIWQLANDMAAMLSRYMTYRPQWLAAWGQNTRLPVAEMIAQKDARHNRLNDREGEQAIYTPDWLIEHYEQLEAAQRFLWLNLFDDDYRYREQIHEQFWQALYHQDGDIAKQCRNKLPKQIFLFTLQQLPPSELLDLQRLGTLTDVTILHFNPSEQFWADIVDKTWLVQQQLDNPHAIYLKDYGHTLLSRFGKQSREVFAMLASLSGNEFESVVWQDDFVEQTPTTLLQFLQHDILMLQEEETPTKIREMLQLMAAQDNTPPNPKLTSRLAEQRQLLQAQLANIQSSGLHNIAKTTELLQKIQAESKRQLSQNQPRWQPRPLDTSLSIHVCHSLVRQLEVLRSMIIGWLNYSDVPASAPEQIPTNSDQRRALSDILVLLPDIDAHQNIIEAIFPSTLGTDGYQLPAKVTGVVAKDINQLWQAITGYYGLLNRAGARFQRAEVFDWLMLTPLYESFGLNLEQMNRACELLTQAGFIRGFDEAHLRQTLNHADDDYRYTFAYALERLVAGVLMPHANNVSFGQYTNLQGEIETIVPLNNLTMADADIVATLCDIYQTLDDNRDLGQTSKTVEAWLTDIEQLIQNKFALFNQTNAWRTIFAAQNNLKSNIDANHKKSAATGNNAAYLPTGHNRIQTEALPLKLGFVLENIAQQIANQQVSAEPSGVITFARIGTVRNLPYDLIVMLNLNLSEFPQQEQQNRYNLMQAGLPTRGDRFREDDDLGAFLDAILCAKQACWLFYNGKSTLDTHEHLPASPVQELLAFLQNNMALPSQEEEAKPNTVSIEQQVQAYLVTQHAALPFDAQYFEIDAPVSASEPHHIAAITPNPVVALAKAALFPPAKIWHNLYTVLQDNTRHHPNVPITTLWTSLELQQWCQTWQQHKHQLDHITDISVQHHEGLTNLLRVLYDPAKGFIRQQAIFVDSSEAIDNSHLEPLTLDALGDYQLNKLFMEKICDGDEPPTQSTQLPASQPSQLAISGSMSEMLPAGVNRYQTLQHAQRQFAKDLKALVVNLQQCPTHPPDGDPQTFAQLATFINHHFSHVNVNDQTAVGKSVAKALSACEEQRLAVDVLRLDDAGHFTCTKQTWVITARLPTPQQGKSPAYWFNYLPQSGSEKYQLQFWLHHLCWQIQRQTTDAQAAANDGYSLWQYRRKKTFYLPAMPSHVAYQYLQDLVMVYQLIGKIITVLPPAVAIEFIQKTRKNPDTNPIKQLGKWLSSNYQSGYIDVNCHHYPIWQLLLKPHKPTVILPFLQTLGELIYQPIVGHMQSL